MAYVLVSLHIGWALIQDKPIHKGVSLGLLLVGMAAHATLLYPYVVTLYGLNFNLFNIISLTSLFFLFFYLLFCLYRPILSLGILAAPTALIGMTVGYIGRAPYQPLTDVSVGLEAHILLSLAAYRVLGGARPAHDRAGGPARLLLGWQSGHLHGSSSLAHDARVLAGRRGVSDRTGRPGLRRSLDRRAFRRGPGPGPGAGHGQLPRVEGLKPRGGGTHGRTWKNSESD